MPPLAPPEEIAEMMRFIAEKSKDVKSPMNLQQLCRQIKEETGSLYLVKSLKKRIDRYRLKIHEMNGFDNDTKVKMIFALSAPIEKGFLNELKKHAKVEVDGKGRITKYRTNDGSLELEGTHGKSSIHKTLHSERWQNICQKAEDNESEEEGDEDANGQKNDENKRINLVRYLIERTKNATSPLSIEKLATDYKKEFKCSESQHCICLRIISFRQRIHEMNQFNTQTKVKMLFALSASIDADFLQKLQKDAIVELDENQKIKKYTTNDGGLDLEGDHSYSAKVKAAMTEMKKKKKMSVVNDQSDSEEDDDKEDSSETDESDEEGDGDTGGSVRSNQASASATKRRSETIRKSTVSTPNHNKKRATTSQKQSAMSNQEKRARISYSSSEGSEDNEESMTHENDPVMDSEANNLDQGGNDFDYDPPVNNLYEENLEHNKTDPNSERNIATPEVMNDDKEETGPSSSVQIESMSLLELLNHFRSPIVKYTPTLVPRIDENIKKLEEKDKQIPFDIIIKSLESCIHILNTPDEMDSDENTTSLSDFYYHLGMAMCNITHSSMDDFHAKMRKLATTGDEKVPLEHIQYAMEETLDKILH